MSVDDGRTAPPPVHRPRTVDRTRPQDPEGGTASSATGPESVLRPRTVAALGRPKPIPAAEAHHRADLAPPLESFEDPSWQPSTGRVPVVAAPGADPDLWTLDDAHADNGPARPEPSARRGAPQTDDRLVRNNLLVASGTAVSRLTGLVRTVLIAEFLSETLADTYLLANNTPNIIYELILGGVLTATLVPIFTEDIEKGDGDATSAVISFTVMALAVLAVVTVALSPLLMALYSIGSPQAAQADVRSAGIRLAILFAPQVFFYGLMALWSAVLNARRRFFAAAWAPVLNNILVIGVLLAARRQVGGTPTVADVLDSTTLLAIIGAGTTLGIVVMALSLYPALRRSGMRLRFRVQGRHPAVRRALRLSAWTIGYVIANQVAGTVVNLLADPGTGGVKDYLTAFQFFQLPHGLLAVSIMVTFAPMLGRSAARADRPAFNAQLLLGFRLIGLLVIPAAVGYLALPTGLGHTIDPDGEGVVAQVLHYGTIVAAFAVGLPGFSTYLYALRGFYAMKDTRTPFLINCGENALNIVAALVFVRWWGIVGLALAYGLAYTVAAVVSVVLLARRSPGFDARGLAVSWVRLVLAAGIMGGVVYGSVVAVGPTGNVGVAFTVAGAIMLGAVTYVAAARAARVPGMEELMARLPLPGGRRPSRREG